MPAAMRTPEPQDEERGADSDFARTEEPQRAHTAEQTQPRTVHARDWRRRAGSDAGGCRSRSSKRSMLPVAGSSQRRPDPRAARLCGTRCGSCRWARWLPSRSATSCAVWKRSADSWRAAGDDGLQPVRGRLLFTSRIGRGAVVDHAAAGPRAFRRRGRGPAGGHHVDHAARLTRSAAHIDGEFRPAAGLLLGGHEQSACR